MIEHVQIQAAKKPTEQALLHAALRLFRKKGFEKTTMREIAREAGMSLGAAYYYFRSKEDLVHAYYGLTQLEHDAKVRDGMPDGTLEQRLLFVFETKLELMSKDRRFLGALFRFAADPAHPLSVFGEQTAPVREQARAIFAHVLEDAHVDASVRPLIVEALWLAQMALLIVTMNDTVDLRRARSIARALATLTSRSVDLLGLPGALVLASPILQPLQDILSTMTAVPQERAKRNEK